MKKKTLLFALVFVAGIVCAFPRFPGYGNFGGKGNYQWPGLTSGDIIDPLSLNPLQWLLGYTAPYTIEDETTNDVTAVLVD